MGQKSSRATSPSRVEPREQSPDAVLGVPVLVPVLDVDAAVPVVDAAAGGRLGLTSRTVSQGDVGRRRGQSRSGERQPPRALTTDDDVMRDAPPVVQQPHRPRPRSRLPVNSARLGSPQVAALYTEAVANIEQARVADPIEPSAVEAVVGSSAPPPPHVSAKPSSSLRRTGSAVSCAASEETPAKHTTSEGAFLKCSTALPPAKGDPLLLDLPVGTSPSTPVPEAGTPGAPDSLSVQSEHSTRQTSESGDACEDVSKTLEEIIDIDMIAPPSADGFYFGTSYREDNGNTDFFTQVQQATLASSDAAQIVEEENEDVSETQDEPKAEAEFAEVEPEAEVTAEPGAESHDVIQSDRAPDTDTELRHESESDQEVSQPSANNRPDEINLKMTTYSKVSEKDMRPEVTEIVKASAVLTAASSIAAPSGSSTAIPDQVEDSYPAGREESADLGDAAGDDSLVGCEVHLKAVAGGIIDPTTDLPALYEEQEAHGRPSDALLGSMGFASAEEDEDGIPEDENSGAESTLASMTNKLQLKRHLSEQPGQSGLPDADLVDKEDNVVLTSRSESSTGHAYTLVGCKNVAGRGRYSESSNRINKLIQSCKQKIFTGKSGGGRRSLEKRPQHRLKSHRFSKSSLSGSSEMAETECAIAETSQEEASDSAHEKEPLPSGFLGMASDSSKPSLCPSKAPSNVIIVEERVSESNPTDTSSPNAENSTESNAGLKKNYVTASLSPKFGSRNRIAMKRSRSNRSRSFSIESDSHSRSSRASIIAPPRTNFLTEDVLRSLARSHVMRYSDMQIASRPRHVSKTPERYRNSPSHRKVKTKSGSASLGSTASSSITSTPKAYSITGVQNSKSKLRKQERRPRMKSKSRKLTEEHPSINNTLREKNVPSSDLQSTCSGQEVPNCPEDLSVHTAENLDEEKRPKKNRKKIESRKKLSTETAPIEKVTEFRKSYQKILESSLEHVKTFKDEFDVLLQNPHSKLLEKSESFQENQPEVPGYLRPGKPHSCIFQENPNVSKAGKVHQNRNLNGMADFHRRLKTKETRCTSLPSNPSKIKNDDSDDNPNDTASEPENAETLGSTKVRPRKYPESLPRYRPTLRTPRISSVGMHAGNEASSILRKNLITEMKAIRSRARITSRHLSRPLHTKMQAPEQCKSTKMVDSTEYNIPSERAEPLKTSFEGLQEITKLLRQYTAIANLDCPNAEVSELVSLFEAPTKHSIPSEDTESRAALCTSPRPSADEVSTLDHLGVTESEECGIISHSSRTENTSAYKSSGSEKVGQAKNLIENDMQNKNKESYVNLNSKEDDLPPNSYSICSKDTEIKIAATLHETVNSPFIDRPQVDVPANDSILSNHPTDSTLRSIEESRFEHAQSLYQLQLPLIHISPPFPDDDMSGRESSLAVQIDASPQESAMEQCVKTDCMDGTPYAYEHFHGYKYIPSSRVSTFAKIAPLFRTDVKVCVDKGMNTSVTEKDKDNVSATVNTSTWCLSPSRHTIEKVSDAVQACATTADADSQAFFSSESLSAGINFEASFLEGNLKSSSQEKLFYRRRALPDDNNTPNQDQSYIVQEGKRDFTGQEKKLEEDVLEITNLLECTISKEYIPRSCHHLVTREENSPAICNDTVNSGSHNTNLITSSVPDSSHGQTVRDEAPKMSGMDRARIRVASMLGEHFPTTIQAMLNEVLPMLLERTQPELLCQRQGALKRLLALDYLSYPANHPSETQSRCSSEVQSFVAEIAERVAFFVEDVARSAEGVPCCQDNQKPP